MLRFLGAILTILMLAPSAAATPLFGEAEAYVDSVEAWVADPWREPEPAHEPAPPQEEAAPAEPQEPAPAAEESEPAPQNGGFLAILPVNPRVLEDAAAPLTPILETLDLSDVDASLPLPTLVDEPAARDAPVESASVATMAAPASAPAPEGDMTVVLPAAAALVAAAALAAAPSASTFSWTRLRRFGFLALLYTRISKERLLDHERRDELLQAIRDQPGTAVTDLVKLTGVPRNTAVYHLTRLEREGLVSSMREGRTRLYFAPGSLEKRANSEALAALRHDTSRMIAMEIGQKPGLDQNALCQRFGLAPSLAHWHADRLISAGLVEKRREGRHVRYYPGSAFALVDAVVIAPAPPAPSRAPPSGA